MNVTDNLKLPQYTGEDIFDLQDINKAYDTIDKAYGDIDDTYKKVVDIKDEIPKTNATAEVINARGGKETLGKRLDEFGSQLDNITHQRLTTITPQMFGCVGDGFTDDTKGLQDAINYCIANGSMLSSDGSKKYLVSSTINIEGNLNINFNMATITTNNSDIGAILKFNNTSDKQCEVNNLRINCNRLAITAIQIDLLKRKFFNNIEITLCLGYGFKIISGYEIFINKSYIMSPAATPNNAYGIYITTHDCHFTDIVMRDVKIAVYSIGSNFFTRVHPWILSKEVILGSVCFYIDNTTFMSDCYGDSYETVFYLNGYVTLNLTNFKTYYNPECYLGDTLGGSKPILFKFPNSDIDGSCIKAYGCYFDGAKNCYSDNSYGSFSNSNKFKYDIVANNDVRYWTDTPKKVTVTEGLVVLEDNFTSTYNRIEKDRNGDFAVLELQAEYTGTLEAGVDTKICSLPYGFKAYKQKQILCSVSTSQWTRESICYGYLTNDGISVKLPNTMTNPYIVVDVTYRVQ